VLADEIGAPSRGVDDEPKAARRLSAGEWCGWYYAQDVGVVWSVCHCCSLIAIVIGSVMCFFRSFGLVVLVLTVVTAGGGGEAGAARRVTSGTLSLL
jgi:hypothetical protein